MMRLQRFIKLTIDYTAYAFTLLILIFSTFYHLGWENILLAENRIRPIFLICLLNAAFIALRNEMLPNIGPLRLGIGMVGNMTIVLLFGWYNKWMLFYWDSIQEVFWVCLMIHLSVLGLIYFRNKRDELKLNRALQSFKQRRNRRK